MGLTQILNTALALLLPGKSLYPGQRGLPAKVIIDTDLFADVDDVGALAVANVLHSCGVIDLAGVMINTQSEYGPLAASAINVYFGNPDVPVAGLRPLTNETFFDKWNFQRGEYAGKVAHNFPRALDDASSSPSPTRLYRQILASSCNVTIISIGFLTNLATLLQSPGDDLSPLDGRELLAANVRELVVMGGKYPSGREFNFALVDPASTHFVFGGNQGRGSRTKTLENSAGHGESSGGDDAGGPVRGGWWPHGAVPITYLGFELGKQVMSGAGLAVDAPEDSPVRAAYEWFVGRGGTLRESWDPLTTLYGALGLHGSSHLGIEPLFEYGNNHGYNSVAEDGSNIWIDDVEVSNEHWLKLAPGVSNQSVAELLDRFYTYKPGSTHCYFASHEQEKEL